MKSLSKTIRATLAACLATLWCSSPVWADDTEIFFGNIDSAAARPNVLFIIDTSGSMSGTVSGTGKDRLDNVKDAFYQLMDELNSVNVGLMRFTNPGGPILYPVKYIDADVNAGSIITVDTPVSSASDDAQEVVGTGLMILNDNLLEIVELSAGGTTFEDQVSSNTDDGEEYSSGNGSTSYSDIWFNSSIDSAMRFTGSTVPAGATITNAYMRFVGDGGGNSSGITMRISGEAVDSGSIGTSGNNITSRTRTTAFVDWAVPTIAGDQSVDTPNLAAIVQEIIDDAGWNPGSGNDDMTFIVVPQSGSGQREIYQRDGSVSRAPRLFVEYYTGAAPSPEVSRVGLRFDAADIPRGVTITDARIVFTADRDFTTTHDLTVAVEDTGDASTFTSTAGNIGGRTTTGSTVAWADTVTYSAGDTFQTPNLSGLIKPVTDRSDWCGGNALSFIINGTLGQLPVTAFDGSASLAPRLVLQYEYDSIPVGSSCIQRTVSRTVNASSDDVEEGQNLLTGTVHDLRSGNPIGTRYLDMTIPQGATVSEAYVELTASGNDSGTTTIQISAEASTDVQTYTSTSGSVTGRSYFSPAVSWSITNSWSTNGVYRSPDLSAMITQVVGQSGWEPGDAIGIQLNTTTSTDRRARTWDNSPAQAPRLVVTFNDDGTGLTSRKVREVMSDLVSQLNHNGWTPIQDTLYEAARYYTGMTAYWGRTRGSSSVDGGPFSYARISAAESMVSGTYSINRPAGCSEDNLNDSDCRNESISGIGSGPLYESPIDDFCQEQSHIILLTDGAANRPHSATEIADFIGESCANEPTINPDGSTTNLSSGERCVKDLVKYMNENDVRPTLTGNQRVTTHTIGFNFSSKWLEDVATAGGGVYTTADNATQLVEQIKAIIGEVLKTDSTFVAPVAAVNEFNQLSHLNQVYFAVFRPDEFPRWPGNLKRYAISEEGTEIVDADGNLAIDPDTGFFDTDARSFWSSTTDGSAVDLGGAAENVPGHASRNVYTYYAGSTSTNLANSINSLVSTNTNLTKAMFDATSMTNAQFAELLDWIRGKDVDDENDNGNTTETRYIYGDPLHSRPVAITYGGTESNPDVEIFFGTNAGALHAVDASNGQETFAFIPEELLPMQNELRENLSTTSHPYGIDGTPTPWTNDNDRDGIDPTDPLDFVRIYTGMRRGGRNYYALDVTDRSNPEIMWQIAGGAIQSNGDDFRELGQTWSRPIKTQIVLSGDTAPREVLILSAGYDEGQDSAQLRTSDSVGRGMYIVDAVTGALIWSGGKTSAQAWTESFSSMDYSFPSTMSVVDINQDGLADMWFAADTGGQLWRFDIRNGETLANLVSGGVIADLGVAGGTNSITANRRFFASPSVALVRGPDGPEMAIAIGSGFRPSPLSVLAENRMFMIRQKAVFGPPSTYTRLTAADLYNATSNTLATATGTALATEQALLYAAQGWYFDLNYSGEKVLSSPLIANDQIIFTTYTPGDSGVWCRPAAGTSRAYAVQLEDAVRTEPRPLLTTSIVDQATIIVPPPYVADPNDPDDPNDPGSACPNGNQIVIKLNAEDGPLDEWCNDANKTYWLREQ